MSVEAIAWAMQMAETGAIPSPTAAHVLIVLANYADGDNVAWPGQRSIAARVMRSDRQVRRALDELERAGLISVESRRRKNGSWTSNRYKLHLDARANPSDTDVLRPSDTHDRYHRTPMSAPDPSVDTTVIKQQPPPTPPNGHEPVTREGGGGANDNPSTPNRLPSGRELALRYAQRAEEVRIALSEPDVDLYVQFRAALRERMSSEYTYRRWLAEAVWPELRRLGPRVFRATVTAAAPRLVDPAIRQPTAWLLKRLQSAEPEAGRRWNVSQMWAGLEYRPVDDDGRPVLDPVTEEERDELISSGLARWIGEAVS